MNLSDISLPFYFNILACINEGRSKPEEIARVMSMPYGSLREPLDKLRSRRFITLENSNDVLTPKGKKILYSYAHPELGCRFPELYERWIFGEQM